MALDFDLILDNWLDLNTIITSASEEEAKDLLDYELKHRCRKMFVLRLYSRYNRMRAERERTALLKHITV